MMHPMRKLLAVAGIAVIYATISASGLEPALRSVQREGGPYRLVPGWGTLPNGATWGEVPGMAIDTSGKVYAFSFVFNRYHVGVYAVYNLQDAMLKELITSG